MDLVSKGELCPGGSQFVARLLGVIRNATAAIWSAERSRQYGGVLRGGDRLVAVVMRLHAEFAGWANLRDVLMVIEQRRNARTGTPAFAAMSEPGGRTRPATA